MRLCLDVSIKMESLVILITSCQEAGERWLLFPHKHSEPLLSPEKTKFLKFQDHSGRDMLTYMLRHNFLKVLLERKNN